MVLSFVALALLLRAQTPRGADTDGACMGCHEGAKEDWSRSIHAGRGIGCIACHGSDEVEGATGKNPHLGRATFRKGFEGPPRGRSYRSHSPDLCRTCHEPIFDAFQKSTHYDVTVHVEEGQTQKVRGCLACHHAHGTRPARLAEILQEACPRCHREGSDPRLLAGRYASAATTLEKVRADLSSGFRKPGISWAREAQVGERAAGVRAEAALQQHTASRASLGRLERDLTAAAEETRAAYLRLESRQRDFRQRYTWLWIFLGLLALNAGLVLAGRRRRGTA